MRIYLGSSQSQLLNKCEFKKGNSLMSGVLIEIQLSYRNKVIELC